MNLPGMPHLGVYRIITADPPWPHNNYGQAKHGAAKASFDEMPLEALCEMPVGELGHPDGSLLALWCTGCQEADGVHRTLAEAWGFRLRTRLATWVKVYERCTTCGHHWNDHDAPFAISADFPGICATCELENGGCGVFAPKSFRGPGNYSMQGCESLWVATRGDFPWCDRRAVRNIPEILFAPTPRKHSEKPERAYARIDALWPRGPKLELFARARRDGYAAWGKEAPACDLVFGAEIGTTWPVPARAVAPPPAAPEPTLFDTTEVPQ